MSFKQGDVVEIISKHGEWNSELEIGMRGVVAYGDKEPGSYKGCCAGVDFSISGREFYSLHRLSGTLDNPTGFWMEVSQLCLVAEEGDPFQIDKSSFDSLFEEVQPC